MDIGQLPEQRENVCVIGAGASGLLATKNLLEHGFAVDCYERETDVGGAWNWRHDRSPIYASTHLISSRPATQFPDFPMPDDWPDYPHHSQVFTYLGRYADHFDLRRHIWFGREAIRVTPSTQDGWDVTTRSTGGGTERTTRYAAVVIANGHNWSPKLPSYEGMDSYQGEVIHASAFQDPATLRGQRVLVVGSGNTGCDLAVEAAQRAAACWHSSRRGYWHVPKYLLGRPADQISEQLLRWRLPGWLRQWLAHRLLRLTVGDLTRFGLPRPEGGFYQNHPIVNSQFVYYLGHGRITPVGDVVRFHRKEVELEGGQRISPDLVIMSTGYLPQFGFVDPELLGIDERGRPRLRLHMFGTHPTLAVAGLLQSDAGLFGMVHWQTVLLARWLRARTADPTRAAALWSWLDGQAGTRWHDGRPRESSRHWFEVNHVRYLRGLEKALGQLEGSR